MDLLQKQLESFLGDIPKLIILRMIREKLTSRGITLSESQLKQLETQVLDQERWRADALRFALEDEPGDENKSVSIELTAEDTTILQREFDSFLDGPLSVLINSTISDLCQNILAQIKQDWPHQSRNERSEIEAFQMRLSHRWGAPIESLRLLLAIGREFGQGFRQKLTERHHDAPAHLIDVLTRLHARACQVTEEIICLLSAGLADGAMARWRTLHEIATVALLIGKHGEEIAERYASHEIIETRKAADQYERYCKRLGQEPPEQTELTAVRESYNSALVKYGKSFQYQYGWAAHHIKKEN